MKIVPSVKGDLTSLKDPTSGQPIAAEIATSPISEVMRRLNTDDTGLSEAQAQERITWYGLNTISVLVPISIGALLYENFLHTMAILLWCAGGIAMIARMPELAVAIWLVNLTNGTFSFWQEFRAEKATEALQELLPTTVQVVRENKPISVPSERLVPGDIFIINEGDKISADARLICSEGLKVDQSTLTGESHPVKKVSDPIAYISGNSGRSSDFSNLVFAGTTVLTGHGSAIVYATGTSTEFGRIARLTQTIADQQSPLQQEMKRVTQIVSCLALCIGAVIFCLAIGFARSNPAQAFVFAMGLIVAFVPEGMVPTVTLSLAIAVQRMARRNALVKRLSAVEALGCTNVICTDKTGTLTQNKMRVTRLSTGNCDFFDAHIEDGNKICSRLSEGIKSSFDLKELLIAGALCNNAKCADYPTVSDTGDPTEIALVRIAMSAGLLKSDLDDQFLRIHENSFESHRKCMSTIHRVPLCGLPIAYVKGSPGHVLQLCDYVLLEGIEKPLDESKRNEILKRIDEYASDGLRLIAAAKKELPSSAHFDAEGVECNLTFLGVFALFDPPHPEVPEAVKQCRSAGIKIVMITGDYEVTAEAVARQVGIVSSQSCRVVTGSELDKMSEEELLNLLSTDVIFARVNPEHKLHVVQAFQRCGKIVAVTGDGVNDAPALKKADIGIAMGRNGTDVARESADIILLDDNFASIVNAVREGRAVYENIKKFAVYVFNSNMAEAVPFVVMLLSCGLVPMPLTVMQVLSIDLGTDMVPAIGLGADESEEDVMLKRPRARSQPLLSQGLLAKALLWYGGIESIAAMSGYFFVNFLNGWPDVPLAAVDSQVWRVATTMTLTCIVTCQIGAVFCCRTQRASIFSKELFANKLILWGVLLEVALLASLIYTPFLQRVFNTAPLGAIELMFALFWTLAIVSIDELRKFVLRRLNK